MAESRTFIFIFLGRLGFYVHICISPHVSFEFNLRKGQKSDKTSEAISERDGNIFIFLGSYFFGGDNLSFRNPCQQKQCHIYNFMKCCAYCVQPGGHTSSVSATNTGSVF